MFDYIIYIILAGLLSCLVFILSLYKKKKSESPAEEVVDVPNEVPNVVRPRPRAIIDPGAGGPRNRAVANRNARARMRVAQAQRQQDHSASEDEETELGEEIVLPDGKIGKKKLAKLQMKAEKKAQREADERDREEKKEREEQKAEIRRLKEKEREEEEAAKEEEERKIREEEEKRQQEEYEKLKVQFEVEEEGFDDNQEEDKEKDILNEFIKYIKKNKVVVLEDLAAQFKLKTQAVIDRIADLQKDGNLTGVVDDRGKFIYVSQTELESVAKFIRQRGRISISDLAEASNTLINLNPEIAVDC